MNFFIKNKVLSDPAIIIPDCLQSLLERISIDFEREEYNWNKPWGVKRFESIVLAKFIMDYSFESILSNKLSENEKISYYTLSQGAFLNIFNEEFAEIGMNYDDMKEVVNNKIEDYFTARKENRQSHKGYYQIFMHVTGGHSRSVLEEELKRKESGLELMYSNDDFISMIPQCKSNIKTLREKIIAFDLAEIMIPHMIRTARQKLRNINVKKIKSLSKKISKESVE